MDTHVRCVRKQYCLLKRYGWPHTHCTECKVSSSTVGLRSHPWHTACEVPSLKFGCAHIHNVHPGIVQLCWLLTCLFVDKNLLILVKRCHTQLSKVMQVSWRWYENWASYEHVRKSAVDSSAPILVKVQRGVVPGKGFHCLSLIHEDTPPPLPGCSCF